VPALKNGFFLDNDADLDKITERFAQASRLAKKRRGVGSDLPSQTYNSGIP
jgi:hypothetical protein